MKKDPKSLSPLSQNLTKYLDQMEKKERERDWVYG